MSGRPTRPLRSQVITAAVIGAVPLLALSYWAASTTRIERQQELHRQAETVASVAAAFLDSGATAGAGLAPDPDVLRQTIARLALPDGSALVVRGARGQVIAGDPDGASDSPFRGRAAVDRLGWTVEVGLPAGLTEAQLLPLQTRNVVLLLVICLTTFAAALAFADHIARQLGRLRLAAQRIAGGDFSDPPRTRTSSLELDELQEAFVTMARRLRAARDDLAQKVEHERGLREELQSLQRQIVRQERLAAVGLLVSGVAHELNNPLQAIVGGVELLEHDPETSAQVRGELAFVKTQTGRARDIIRKLSRFSSPNTGSPERVDLRDVVAEVVRMRRMELDAAGIQLDVDLEAVAPVESSFTEIQQVLLNFVVNAEQAVQSRGRDGRIAIRLRQAYGHAQLEVADNGPGVSTADEPKLFQPFFTTKPVGRGTGLGLSVSYGIIESYGGTIGYRRNDWDGATFFFELPCLTVNPVRTR